MSLRAWRRVGVDAKEMAIAGTTAALEGAQTTRQAPRTYNKVPPEQVAKDHLFGAIVGALAPFLGWEQARTSVHLSSAEIEMTRDAGDAGFVKDGIRVVLA